ncbi:hypothetical protein JCM8547_002675 [Rhodosporidiobolus lusitaniae]
MSATRPKTPTVTPRKTVPSRPASRASSRPSSPSKASFNSGGSLARTSTTSLETSRPASRVSFTSHDGRASPTKRGSAVCGSSTPLCPTRPSSSSLRTKGASSTSIALSTATGPRTPSKLKMERPSEASTLSGAETDDEHDRADVPRRRPGFGSLSGPGAREDSGSFLGGKGGKGRSSLVDLEETETEDQGETGGTDDGEEDDDETETEEDDTEGKKQNVVVCLRVRPPKSSSTDSATEFYSLSPKSASLSLAPSHPTLLKRLGSTGRPPSSSSSDEYTFRFDLLHVSPSPTVELYDRKIRPVVRATMAGYNGTVFAYGQTASGKTHTMMGSKEEPGIIPLAVDELFEYIHKQNTRRTYSLRVSFLEIYNEQLRDLLAPPPASSSSSSSTQRPPEIVDNGVVKNLTERGVSLPAEVLEVLREGEQRRRVGATDWNERSSRSHCVFVVTIESMSKSATGSAPRTSKLNLIDLAGSESATGQTERLKEGAFINRSLLTLGTVISKLSESASSSHPSSTAHIPYRDSKLTRLLQPALSGNSRVAVVCTISPDAQQATETLSTLKFARRAKMVVTKAERGVLLTDQLLIKQYAQQVEALQAQIREAENGEAELRAREEREGREEAERRADEAERAGKEAQSALATTTAELALLRAQLEKTQSLILTGPSLEASARRASSSFRSAVVELGEILSPSRTFSGSFSRVMGGGVRSVSEMSALGLGTPLTMKGKRRAPSAQARLEEEEEGREREREGKIIQLESDLVSTRAALSTLEASFSSTAADLDTVRAELASTASELSTAREGLVEKDGRIGELEKEVEELRKRVKELEAELVPLREENVAASSAQQAAEAKATDANQRLDDSTRTAAAEKAALEKERDLALSASSDASTRIAELEDLLALSHSTSAASESQLQREVRDAHKAAREKEDEVERLRRLVEMHEENEQRPQRYKEAQRQGTEALKTRLAEMQARVSASAASSSSSSSYAVSKDRPLGAKSSSSSVLSLSSSTSSLNGLTEAEEQLRARIGELEHREKEEREREERRREERNGWVREVEREKRRREGAEEREEGWRAKYLALQKLMDQLNASQPSAQPQLPPPPPQQQENLPLRSTSHSSTSSASSLDSKPPRKPSSSSTRFTRPPLGLSQPSSRPLPSPLPSQPSSFSPGPGPYSPNLSRDQPPPLPYSPQQNALSSTKAARKHRRETIAKDLERLRERGRGVVGERKGGWESPTVEGRGSPVKGSWERDAERRVRKSSWEA